MIKAALRFTINSAKLRVAAVLLPTLSLFLSLAPAQADSPFSVGERLDFNVYLEFVLGGTSTMAVGDFEEVNGEKCWRFVSTAHSTPTVDMFYKVRDRVESWVSVESGGTMRYLKRLREGKYRDEKRVEYFHDDGTVYVHDDSKPTDTLQFAGRPLDVLAALYAVRRMTLEPGQSVWLDVHDIRKQYRLEVRVLRREKASVPAGTFDCVVVEPMLQSSGIFRREGELQVWMTDDARHMPVMMQSKLYFGSVYAKLTGYRKGD